MLARTADESEECLTAPVLVWEQVHKTGSTWGKLNKTKEQRAAQKKKQQSEGRK